MGDEFKIIKRVIKIPVSYHTTDLKLAYLDKLTARFTSCVRLFCSKIEETGKCSRKALTGYEKEIANVTRLSAGFIQQAKDKAIWMYKSYNRLHKSWQYRISKTKKDTKYYKKLLKREPSKPGTNSRNKIPIWLDNRTCVLKTGYGFEGPLIKPFKKEITISYLWLNISTLVKGLRIMVPLNHSKYHIEKLEKADKIVQCELVKKRKKWYLHVMCDYKIHIPPVNCIRSIDLGIARSVTAVLLNPGLRLRKSDIFMIREGKKKHRIEKFDRLIAKLQILERWKHLREIRQRRADYIEDQERNLAKRIALQSIGCKVAIGYPKGLKSKMYKGNNKRRLRRKLQKWAYGRMINYITYACEERGIVVIPTKEYRTSKTCSKCNSQDTQRPFQENYAWFKCNSCGIMLNADVNGAVNILRNSLNFWDTRKRCNLFLSVGRNLMKEQVLFHQGASDEHARTRDDYIQKCMSLEATYEA